MRIYLVRHGAAKCEYDEAAPEPALTDIGLWQAKTVGTYLKSHGMVPNYVLASPLLRAQQTAHLIMEQCTLTDLRTESAFTPDGDAIEMQAIIDIIDTPSLLIISHLPVIECLAYRLCGECPGGFGNCTIMTLDYSPEEQSGTCLSLLHPQQLLA